MTRVAKSSSSGQTFFMSSGQNRNLEKAKFQVPVHPTWYDYGTVEPLLTDTPIKQTPLSGQLSKVPAISLIKPYSYSTTPFKRTS